MNGNTLAFVLLRLAALYFVYQAVLQAPWAVSIIGSHMYGEPSAPLLATFGFFVLIWVSVFLWFGASWLSAKVSANEPDQASSSAETKGVTEDSLLTVGLILLGIFALYTVFSSLFSQIAGLLFWSGRPDQIVETLVRSVLPIAFGLLCVISPGSILGLINRLRQVGKI